MKETQGTFGLNHCWSTIIVKALVDRGIKTFFVSPGYRNVPLVSALFSMQDAVEVYSCVDERAAAYQALGYSRFSEEPVVLICTSGTALANYFPAVIEAYQDHVPLLILSADRPFELRRAAANQVIEQSGIFGSFVKKSLSLPEPSRLISSVSLLNNLQVIIRALQSFPEGPCHINVPFREPLEPEALSEQESQELNVWLESLGQSPKVNYKPKIFAGTLVSNIDFDAWSDMIHSAKAPLVLVGRLDREDDRKAIRDWLQNCYSGPVYLDITSSLKGQIPSIQDPSRPAVIQKLEAYQPDLIIHFGKRLVSKYFDRYFATHPVEAYLCVSAESGWQDPSHVGVQHYQMPPRSIIPLLSENKLSVAQDRQASQRELYESETKLEDLSMGNHDDRLDWPYIVKTLLQALPAELSLMLGNSACIRAFDQYQKADLHPRLMFANRGVSGIEGQVSTAIGIALAQKKPVVAILGDVSLIHDLNALLSVAQSPEPVSVIVVNDSGGGIFRKLPIAKYPNLMNPLLVTPHDFQFAGIAEMARLPYFKIKSKRDWQGFCEAQWHQPQKFLVELTLNQD